MAHPAARSAATMPAWGGFPSEMAPALWEGGPRPGRATGYSATSDGHRATAVSAGLPPSEPRAHTTQPIVTGTSVLGIKFDGGVMMAADTLGSYGALARFRDQTRLTTVGDNTVVGASGDLSDFNSIVETLKALETEQHVWQDGHRIKPSAVHSFLTRVLYNRRSNMNPLWNTCLVGGCFKGKTFLGFVDKLGVAFEDAAIATGYGAHIATPLLRTAIEENPNMSEADARKIMERCLRVLYYRDARSLNRYQIAVAKDDGTTISEPFTLETNWDIARYVKGYE